MAISYPINRFLGANVKAFPKTQYEKIVEIIDAVNDLNDGDVTLVDLELTGTLDVDGVTTLGASTPVTVSATGILASALTTDSTSKDTGAVILEGGMGVEKRINAGTAIAAGTTLTAATQLLVSATSNQIRLGNTSANDVIISSTAPAADSVYTIPDAGTVANFVMSESTQTINGAKTFGTGITLPDGAVGSLSVRIGADANNGLYGVSDTQLGVAVEGALVSVFDTVGLKTDSIGELVTANSITMLKSVIHKNTGAAINISATATAAEVKGGLITSTSAAAVTITLPTGTDLGTALGAVQGTVFDLVIDNTAGANTVTLAVGANNIQSAWSVYQDVGGATLDVVSGVTGTGVFRFVFSSATACTFCRIA